MMGTGGNMAIETGQEWADKLEHLHRAAVAVAGAHRVEDALQRVVDAAREVVGARLAAIGVPGEPGEPMAHFVVSGVSPEAIEQAGHAPMGHGVLGVLLREGEPVRLSHIADHPAYMGLPDNHPPFTSFLGVPVKGRGEVIGDLYLADKIAEEVFSEEDQRLAEMLAAHAAVVIQTLRYHKKNEEIALVRAKARLAPKIEDDVLQAIYGAGLLLRTLDLSDPGHANDQIEDIAGRLDSAIQGLRRHLLEMTTPLP